METNEPSQLRSTHRPWPAKFLDAGRGMLIGIRSGNSYTVHSFFTIAVIIAAVVFGVDRIEWCLLVFCIAAVFTAEHLNSGLELLAKAITAERNPYVRDALDMGSGAVMVISLGAVIIGLIVFIPHVLKWFE